jgi:hypothetical protein
MEFIGRVVEISLLGATFARSHWSLVSGNGRDRFSDSCQRQIQHRHQDPRQ